MFQFCFLELITVPNSLKVKLLLYGMSFYFVYKSVLLYTVTITN